MKSASMTKAKERMHQPPASPVLVDTDKPYSVKPGALRGESSVIIKTRLAQHLVFGRSGSQDRNAVIGLIGFAGMIKAICQGVKLDDPYADQWLLNIEQTINGSSAEIAQLQEKLDRALLQRNDFNHQVAHSVEPIEVPLYFSSRLAFMAAYLINDYDYLVCTALTVKHVALMPINKVDGFIRSASRAVRRAFESGKGYQYLGVSRADIVHKTAKPQAAIERWGEIDPKILNGSLRAESAPPLSEKSYVHRIIADEAIQ